MQKEITTNQARKMIQEAKKSFLEKMGHHSLIFEVMPGDKKIINYLSIDKDIAFKYVSRLEVEMYFMKTAGGNKGEETFWTPRSNCLESLRNGKLVYV